MISPRPPPPAIAAIVAVAITKIGGDPNPGDDERQPERQLDAHEDLPLGQPHPPGRLDDVAVDAVDREVRVREDRRDREHDERGRVVPEADAEDVRPNAISTMLGSARPTFETLEREEEAAMTVAEPEPERQREHERDPERGERRARDARPSSSRAAEPRCRR